MVPFSLLLPVYQEDRVDFLQRAVASSVGEQALPPSEVVIVRDGPVPAPLQHFLDDVVDAWEVPVRVVALERNVGLGQALDAGLAACSYDVVARIDADDISLPDRFKKQIKLLEDGYDLVGSGLLEIGTDEHDILGSRTPPTGAEEIVTSARFHDPFNHPSVVYRRSAVQAAGGYRDLPLMEDYWLFARMISAGARVANLAEPLVLYRVGAGAFKRRGGLRLLRSELALQRRFRSEGFTTHLQLVRNVAVRGGYRLVPEAVRRMAYRRLIANRRRQPERA